MAARTEVSGRVRWRSALPQTCHKHRMSCRDGRLWFAFSPSYFMAVSFSNLLFWHHSDRRHGGPRGVIHSPDDCALFGCLSPAVLNDWWLDRRLFCASIQSSNLTFNVFDSLCLPSSPLTTPPPPPPLPYPGKTHTHTHTHTHKTADYS